ncbi:hypothetical protein [Lentibacillus sp. CBA3610]|uniref:anti-sigma-I factor RsgI family protein n=1 Tax=Lentibacillus sp. CBA3610 TaxID=2518176 RepID=UPI0015951265|nr:hypothetical protein [Lentibacillus sp. CBA3610]QKY68477.1 hypothetical protein Len3610_01555 [Lentibacillus sp. CBA3610]
MKKGIVMEKHRDFIIVMRKDGAFQKASPLENEDASVGMEVSYKPFAGKRRPLFYYITKKKFISFQIAAIFCLLLLLMPFYFMVDENQTYAYVNITVNPNLELEIDDELNVKSISPLNDDAEDVLQKLAGFEGDHLENVIQQIMNESEETNLLQNGKSLLAGVSYIQDTHTLSVTQAIDDYFMEQDEGWRIVTFQIPKDIRKASRDNEQSMNELMAVNLIETDAYAESADADISVDDNEKEIIHSFYNNHHSDSESAAKEKVTQNNGKAPK